MVDAIGINGAKMERPRVVAPTPAAPTAAAAAPSPQRQAAAETGALARVLAAEPPVDADRVARIKRAIAAGAFPISPATIADRLLALRLEWNSNDPA